MPWGACQRKQLIAPAIRKFWKAVQQHHTRLAGRLKAGLENMQDYTIVGVHASGTHASRQGTPTILNAVVFTGARVARSYIFARNQDRVRGKKAQRLQEMPSRNVAASHVHWLHLLRATTAVSKRHFEVYAANEGKAPKWDFHSAFQCATNARRSCGTIPAPPILTPS